MTEPVAMKSAMKWTDVPGMFDEDDGAVVQRVVRNMIDRTDATTAMESMVHRRAHVELGAWCGRSLAAACEVLPENGLALSFDNYLEDSQAAGGAGKTPAEARVLRDEVITYYRHLGRNVHGEVKEASQAGRDYTGPPVHSLLVDDHHTAEQVEANILAWARHMARRSVLLFHDYRHPPYRIEETCSRMLPTLGYTFRGQIGGLGIWERGCDLFPFLRGPR